jgi:hypothetical protein
MRSITTSAVIGLVGLLVALLPAGATAANWDPVNTVVDGQGTLTIGTSSSLSIMCTATIRAKSTGGDVLQTVNAAGTAAPPTFSDCTDTVFGATTVTASTPWSATATSTTAVDLTNLNVDFNTLNGSCTLSWDNVSLANNVWSNTGHTLTFNSSTSFPVTSSVFCPSVSTMTISGTVNFPATTTIT